MKNTLKKISVFLLMSMSCWQIKAMNSENNVITEQAEKKVFEMY